MKSPDPDMDAKLNSHSCIVLFLSGWRVEPLDFYSNGGGGGEAGVHGTKQNHK